MQTNKDILEFLEHRLAAHEGGAGMISISYDDATFDYIISQVNINSAFRQNEILGCSRSLSRAFALAISGKRYED